MPLPSEILAILNVTEDAARNYLRGVGNDAAAAGADGGAEALATVDGWRTRMGVLNARWGNGTLALEDFKAAAESEREALAFNLASIPNERKREFLSNLLGRSLDFLGAILGAGLAAVRRTR